MIEHSPSVETLAAALHAGLIQPGQIWRGHHEFPGYLIGSHGQLLSFQKPKPKVLSPIRVGAYDGYQLRHSSGKLVKQYRHRLVAEVFFGPCPPGNECRHLDGDRENADATNLRWGTRQENAADKIAHGTHSHGEEHASSKLTDDEVLGMRQMRCKEGMTYREIARRFGVTTMTAFRAIKGECWGHLQ